MTHLFDSISFHPILHASWLAAKAAICIPTECWIWPRARLLLTPSNMKGTGQYAVQATAGQSYSIGMQENLF